MDGGSPYFVDKSDWATGLLFVIGGIVNILIKRLFSRPLTLVDGKVGWMITQLKHGRSLFTVRFHPEFSLAENELTLFDFPGIKFQEGVILNQYGICIGEYFINNHFMIGWIHDYEPLGLSQYL